MQGAWQGVENVNRRQRPEVAADEWRATQNSYGSERRQWESDQNCIKVYRAVSALHNKRETLG
jgi:hypothetical protein